MVGVFVDWKGGFENQLVDPIHIKRLLNACVERWSRPREFDLFTWCTSFPW